MHIAYVSPFPKEATDIPNTNGVPFYTYHLVAGILGQQKNNRLDVDVFSPSEDDAIRKKSKVHITIEGDSVGMVVVERNFSRSIFGLFKLIVVVLKRGYDIVHVQHETFLYGGVFTFALFPFFVWMLRWRSIVVVTLHHVVSQNDINDTFPKLHHSTHSPALIRYGYRFFYRLLGRTASKLIVHYPVFRDVLILEYGIPATTVEVIPHGVEDLTKLTKMNNLELRKLFDLPPSTQTIFGFLGFIAGYKGIDYLLDEFAEHAKHNAHSVLLLCGGDHPYHKNNPSYQEYVRSLKEKASSIPGNHIKWLGFLDGSKVDEFYSVIDCIVLPYRTRFAASGPLMFAMGSGKPILASDHLQTFLPEPSLIFSLEKNTLARCLTEFHNLSNEERIALAAPIKAIRNDYKWTTIGKRTVDLYKELLAEKKNGKEPILILGAYGQNNLGDEIALRNCLSYLRKERCVISSAQPTLTEQEYDIPAINSQRRPIRKLITFLLAKTIVVGGGDQFKILKKSVGRFRYALLVQYFLIALLARILHKQLFFVGIGIGNISSKFARMLTNWSIRLATFTTIRDQNSYQYIREGVPHANTALSSDLAFLEPNGKGAESNGIRGNERLSLLGIAPVFNIEHAEAYPLVVHEIGNAIDGFLGDDPRRKTVFLPFQTGFNTHHDIVTSREILAHAEQGHRCNIDETLGTESVGSAYRSIDFLWGMRLHSLILACIHTVPFIALVYDVKVKNFLEEIDYADWCIPLDAAFSAEKLLALQKGLEEHSAEIRHHLQSQAQKLRRRAQINVTLLEGIQNGKCFEWPQTEDLSAISASESRGSIFTSPIPHHHTVQKTSWKKQM